MTTALKLTSPTSYHALNTETAIDYLAHTPSLAKRLGGDVSHWHCREVGDGNLNLVFIITGTQSSLVLKQALPYVRLVGESWPLPLTRAHYEHLALAEQYRHAPKLVPQTYHYNETMALTVMENLSPHIILRKELIAAKEFPKLSDHLGEYLALTLFNTSDLALTAAEKRQKMTPYLGNNAMCKITEDLIFDEPYFAAPLNKHTPGLLDIVSEFHRDTALKCAVQQMKWRFLNAPEALCHGDLHTGSIMTTPDDTRVIDPEFAFYGPFGFDTGMLLANFVMAYYAQDGYGARSEYKAWLLSVIIATYEKFTTTLAQLWDNRSGDAYQNRIITSADNATALQARMQFIWQDTLGFCGTEIIRRILGLAHIADFEDIADEALRAMCERKALLLGRELLVNPRKFSSIKDLAASIQ
jgi:5-methylthioribose kinase